MREKIVERISNEKQRAVMENDIRMRVIEILEGMDFLQAGIHEGYELEIDYSGDDKGELVKGVCRELVDRLNIDGLHINPKLVKDYVDIEVMMIQPRTLEDIMTLVKGKNERHLAIPLGSNNKNEAVIKDLKEVKHILIGGNVGSGKSSFLHYMICSLMNQAQKKPIRLLLIDPKVVEFYIYKGRPELLCDPITTPMLGAVALEWLCNEMVRRYNTFSDAGVRNIDAYNTKSDKKMEHIVVFIDELADLMMADAERTEDMISRMGMMAPAAGIHLIAATQRPSIDVCTGLIKINLYAKCAFSMTSSEDSIIVIDQPGAEELEGPGQCLYFDDNSEELENYHTFKTTEKEIEAYLRKLEVLENSDGFMLSQDDLVGYLKEKEEEYGLNVDLNYVDEVINEFAPKGKVSIAKLQRKYKIGYNKASRIMDYLDKKGVVDKARGNRPRKFLMTYDEWKENQNQLSDEV